MFVCLECNKKFRKPRETCSNCGGVDIDLDDPISFSISSKSRNNTPADEKSDLDQNNPVDCSKEVWQDIYSNPDYDLDNDFSMNY